MNEEPEEEEHLAEEETIGPIKRVRSKRKKNKPKWLNGFQLY
jgi:hypothetical protein